VFGLDLDVERTDVVSVALEDGLENREELLVVGAVVVLVESLNTMESLISASFCGPPKIPPNKVFCLAEPKGA